MQIVGIEGNHPSSIRDRLLGSYQFSRHPPEHDAQQDYHLGFKVEQGWPPKVPPGTPQAGCPGLVARL